jgi:hypothetical protein
MISVRVMMVRINKGSGGRKMFDRCMEFTEFAEYTSAQERIALGKKGRKKEAEKRKRAMQEMIHDA